MIPSPDELARAVGVPEEKCDQIRRGLEEFFAIAVRHDLTHVVVFVAVREVHLIEYSSGVSQSAIIVFEQVFESVSVSGGCGK